MKVVLHILVSALALVGGAGLMSVAGGCGSRGPEVGPATVRGKVTLNGQPVAGGLVVFTPNAERGGAGKCAFAETGPDGSYTLQLNRATAIPPGWYRVSLAPAPSLAPPEGGAFPAQLARPDMSGLEREVKPGKEHVFEFVVDVPKE